MKPLQRYIVTQDESLEFEVQDIGAWDTTLAISALAPLTWEVADYTLTIQKK